MSGRSCLIGLAAPLFLAAQPSLATDWNSEMILQYGGTYSTRCGDPSAPHLRADAQGLQVEVGHRRMTGRNVQVSVAPFGNQAPPPGEEVVTLLSEVRSGHGLSFWVHRDTSGQFVELEVDPPIASALGPAVVAGRFRDCNAVRSLNAAANAKADIERASAERAALNARPAAGEARFRRAYRRALGPLAQNEAWLVEQVPRPTDATTVTVAGTRFQQLTGCKPHDCGDNNAVVLFSPQTGAVYGQVMVRGAIHRIGAPPPDVSGLLERLWRSEWRQGR